MSYIFGFVIQCDKFSRLKTIPSINSWCECREATEFVRIRQATEAVFAAKNRYRERGKNKEYSDSMYVEGCSGSCKREGIAMIKLSKGHVMGMMVMRWTKTMRSWVSDGIRKKGRPLIPCWLIWEKKWIWDISTRGQKCGRGAVGSDIHVVLSRF